MEMLANKPLTVKEKLIELLGLKEDPSISVIVRKDELIFTGDGKIVFRAK